MPTGPSPTVRRRQLGMELRRLREVAQKTQHDAAQWRGIQDTAISKMETGKQKVSQAYLRLLFQLYEVGSPDAEFLDQLRRESGQRAWFAEYGKTVPSWSNDYLGMETAAVEVWTYEYEFVLRAVINEGALRRQINGPAVMRSQIRRIAEMDKLPKSENSPTRRTTRRARQQEPRCSGAHVHGCTEWAAFTAGVKDQQCS